MTATADAGPFKTCPDDTAVIDPAAWREVALFLRDDPRLAMNMFVDLTAVDYLWTLDRRRDWSARVSQALQGYDAFVMPTVACIAPPLAPLVADETAYRRTNARVLRATPRIVATSHLLLPRLVSHPPIERIRWIGVVYG